MEKVYDDKSQTWASCSNEIHVGAEYLLVSCSIGSEGIHSCSNEMLVGLKRSADLVTWAYVEWGEDFVDEPHLCQWDARSDQVELNPDKPMVVTHVVCFDFRFEKVNHGVHKLIPESEGPNIVDINGNVDVAGSLNKDWEIESIDNKTRLKEDFDRPDEPFL